MLNIIYIYPVKVNSNYEYIAIINWLKILIVFLYRNAVSVGYLTINKVPSLMKIKCYFLNKYIKII